jgi:hypothetical protein
MSKFREDQKVKLVAVPEEGFPEQNAVIISVDEHTKTAVVQVDPEDAEDDGIREVDFSQIKPNETK